MQQGYGFTRAAATVLTALLLFAALGCGGKHSSQSTGPTLGRSSAGGGATAASDASHRGVPVSDLYKYGPRIQTIMASPLWDAPMPAQVSAVDTSAVPTPTKITAADILACKAVVEPRDPQVTGRYAKGASFMPVKGQTTAAPIAAYRRTTDPSSPFGGPAPTDPSIFQPVYDFNTAQTPPFGRDSAPRDGFEDIIAQVSPIGASATGFVFRGIPKYNQWMTQGFTFACAQTWQIASADNEVSYLETPNNPGTPTAFKVEGQNYLRFNSFVNLNPVGTPNWHYYDFYVAPTSAESAPFISGSGWNTAATIQHFYIDRSALPVGENAMVRLVSSDCPQLIQLIIPALAPAASVPVFGAIYQRWADEVDTPTQQPWEGKMGWPVQPPIALNNGDLRSNVKGAYRTYGQYFEKGFIYWFDYVVPYVPDDTLAYGYTGTSVFAQDGKYVQSDNGVVSYGGIGGPLRLTAVASNTLRGKDSLGDVLASIGDFITFRAFAYGGAGPSRYTDIIWNYRDGTVDWNQGAGSNYDSKRFTGHVYINEGIYKPRAMVIQDNAADFSTGVNVAIADTPTIRVGTAPAKIAIVRAFPASDAQLGVEDADITPIVDDLKLEGWRDYDIIVMNSVPASATTLTPYRGVFWVFTGTRIANLASAIPSHKLPSSYQDVMRAYINDTGNRHNLFVVGSTILGTYDYPGWWTGSSYLYWDTDFYENYMGIVFRSGWSFGFSFPDAGMTGGLVTSFPPYVSDNTTIRAGAGKPETTWSKTEYRWTRSDRWIYRNLSGNAWLCGCNRLPSGNDVVTFASDWKNVVTYAPLTRKNLLRKILSAADPNLVPFGPSGNAFVPDNPREDVTNPGDAKIVNVFAYTSEADGTWSGGASLNPASPALVTTVPPSPNNRRVVHYEIQLRVRHDDVLSGRFAFFRYGWTFGDAGTAVVETNQQNPLHTYTGAVNGSNPPNSPGAPYFVACYVKRPTGPDPTTGTYDTFRWMNNDGVTPAGVWVQISGPQPLRIVNDGSALAGPFTFDPAYNGAPVTFKYRIFGGNPPYNTLSWYLDTTSGSPLSTTTDPPASGSQAVVVPAGQHVVYAKVTDLDAAIPPLQATVQYPLVTVGRLPVAIVRDSSVGDDTPMASALQAALTTIYGSAQSVFDAGTVTQAQLNSYRVIVWSYRESSYSNPLSGPETAPNTDTNKIKSFIEQGGYFLGFWGNAFYWSADYGPWVTSAMQTAVSPFSRYLSWFNDGTVPVADGSPMATGPGGTLALIYFNYASPYSDTLYSFGVGSSTWLTSEDGSPGSFMSGGLRSDTGSGGTGKNIQLMWGFEDIIGTDTTSAAAAARAQVMKNTLNAFAPDLVP